MFVCASWLWLCFIVPVLMGLILCAICLCLVWLDTVYG